MNTASRNIRLIILLLPFSNLKLEAVKDLCNHILNTWGHANSKSSYVLKHHLLGVYIFHKLGMIRIQLGK